MNRTSACFINFRTNNVFLEPEGPPTIHVSGCFHVNTSSHGPLTEDHYTLCVGFGVFIYDDILCL